MYAVIKTGGKQYRVSEGDEIVVEKLETPVGGKVEFKEVLLAVDGDSVAIGKPLLDQTTVMAEVSGQLRGDKVRIAKYKAKVRYRKVQGFRAKLTKLKVKKIVSGDTNLLRGAKLKVPPKSDKKLTLRENKA